MQNLKPYLLFNGNCKEALEFYETHLNGKILFSETYADSPLNVKEEDKLKIMHATFQFWGGELMASDNVAGADWTDPKTASTNIQLSVGFSDLKLEEKVFNTFAEEGSIKMPLQNTFWGDYFGIVQDRFGITWMFSGRKET